MSSLFFQKEIVSGRDLRFKTEIYPVGELLDTSEDDSGQLIYCNVSRHLKQV